MRPIKRFTGEYDAPFHFANMFLSILEEAHTQWAVERSMPEDDGDRSDLIYDRHSYAIWATSRGRTSSSSIDSARVA